MNAIETFYTSGQYLASNEGEIHKDDSAYKAKWILKAILSNNIPTGNVCEIGCGAGHIIAMLQKDLPEGSNFSGYDIAEPHITLGKHYENKNLKLVVGDVFKTDETFDLALCIDILEHLESPHQFLSQLKAKSNYKIFNIPLDLSVQTLLRVSPIQTTREQVGHLHYYFKETALDLLTTCGYEIISHQYLPFSLELSHRPLIMRLLEIPRRIGYFFNKDLTVRLLGGYSLLVIAK